MKSAGDFPGVEVVYVDTSAAFKLVRSEKESRPFAEFTLGRKLTSSKLTRLEVLRSAMREDSPAGTGPANAHVAKALRVLQKVYFKSVDDKVLDVASRIPHPSLKSLDAMHIATAVLSEADLFVTYDKRQAEAAESVGLKVVSPS
jgi:predicted nucleic acid-binding protein